MDDQKDVEPKNSRHSERDGQNSNRKKRRSEKQMERARRYREWKSAMTGYSMVDYYSTPGVNDKFTDGLPTNVQIAFYMPVATVGHQPINLSRSKLLPQEKHNFANDNINVTAPEIRTEMQNKVETEMTKTSGMDRCMGLDSRLNPDARIFVPAQPILRERPLNDAGVICESQILNVAAEANTYLPRHEANFKNNGSQCEEFNRICELKVKRKKKKRSAKQIERARVYRERKYGQVETKTENSMDLGENTEPSDAPTKDAIRDDTEQQGNNLTTDEQADIESDRNVSIQNSLTPEDTGIFSIMAVYVNSGLHAEFDSTVETVQKNTQNEDFGYEYFSLSNF